MGRKVPFFVRERGLFEGFPRLTGRKNRIDLQWSDQRESKLSRYENSASTPCKPFSMLPFLLQEVQAVCGPRGRKRPFVGCAATKVRKHVYYSDILQIICCQAENLPALLNGSNRPLR